MKKKRAVKNIPPRLPYSATVSTFILMDYTGAPGWVWGIVGTLFAIIWISVICVMAVTEYVDVFEEDQAPKNQLRKKSRFKERLEQMQRDN